MSSDNAVSSGEYTAGDTSALDGQSTSDTTESVPDTVSGGDYQQYITLVYDDADVVENLLGVNDKLLFLCVLALVAFLWGLWRVVYKFFDMFF